MRAKKNINVRIMQRIPRRWSYAGIKSSKGLNQLQKPWTKILLVVSDWSLEKRSNQPKYKEPKTRSLKTTAELIQESQYNIDGECRNKNCLKGRGGNDVQHKN